MLKNYILTLILVFASLQADEKEPIRKSLNFTSIGSEEKLAPEAYGSYAELRKWANFQGMKLQKDSRKMQIYDGICRMIPGAGLEFFLEVEKEMHKKVYLHLDLTTYESTPTSKYPIRSLTVFIKGKAKKTIYYRPGFIEENPAILDIDPSELDKGKIHVRLVPDYTEGGMFWGIWDAFYTLQKEKN